MTIQEIALIKADEYENKYREWCYQNPGSVMCNYPIMKKACLKIYTFGSIEEIELYKKECSDKYDSFKGQMNGWGVFVRTCNIIIDELNKINSNE